MLCWYLWLCLDVSFSAYVFVASVSSTIASTTSDTTGLLAALQNMTTAKQQKQSQPPQAALFNGNQRPIPQEQILVSLANGASNKVSSAATNRNNVANSNSPQMAVRGQNNVSSVNNNNQIPSSSSTSLYSSDLTSSSHRNSHNNNVTVESGLNSPANSKNQGFSSANTRSNTNNVNDKGLTAQAILASLSPEQLQCLQDSGLDLSSLGLSAGNPGQQQSQQSPSTPSTDTNPLVQSHLDNIISSGLGTSLVQPPNSYPSTNPILSHNNNHIHQKLPISKPPATTSVSTMSVQRTGMILRFR